MEPSVKRLKIDSTAEENIEENPEDGSTTKHKAPADEGARNDDAVHVASSSRPLSQSSPSPDDVTEARRASFGEAKATEADEEEAVSLAAAAVVSLSNPQSGPTKPIEGIEETNKRDNIWNTMFKNLQRYKAQVGDCNVPQTYKEDPKLGRWAHYQRVEYWQLKNRGQGKITQARIEKLEELGFEWDPQTTRWMVMFRRLEDFKEQFGHCRVPKGYRADRELANWVRNQRLEDANLQRGKPSRMTEDRRERLEGLGFRWSNTST